MLVACATTTKFMETEERRERRKERGREKEVLSRGGACQEATARRGAKGA